MKTSDKTSGEIPQLNIYGDQGTVPGLPGVKPDESIDIHIEDIQSRAPELDYTIKPHVHRDWLQLAVATSGACDLQLDNRQQRLQSPCIVSIPGGVVHAFRFQADARGWVLTVAHHLLLRTQLGDQLEAGDQFLAPLLREAFVLEFNNQPQRIQVFSTLLRLLHEEFHADNAAKTACLEHFLRIILIHQRREIDYSQRVIQNTDRNRKLFYDFRGLVEQHYREHWAIQDYARALKCSQPRLNKVCKIFTDGGANIVVLNRLTQEAKRLLTFTTAPAANIAYGLGFQDPSYFSRFFKRQTGITPGEFRKT